MLISQVFASEMATIPSYNAPVNVSYLVVAGGGGGYRTYTWSSSGSIRF